MESNTQGQSGPRSTGAVQGENVPQLRDDRPHNVGSQNVGSSSNDHAEQGSDPVFQRVEAERQARAKIEAGHAASLHFTGRKARNDQSAALFADYDPKNRLPQPCEFYRFRDPEIDRWGYL